MKAELILVTKRFLKWFLALFRHFYAIKENGDIIGYVGVDGTFTNCITENVTLRGIVASGKMLLSDRQKSLSEEQHDEPEKQV